MLLHPGAAGNTIASANEWQRSFVEFLLGEDPTPLTRRSQAR